MSQPPNLITLPSDTLTQRFLRDFSSDNHRHLSLATFAAAAAEATNKIGILDIDRNAADFEKKIQLVFQFTLSGNGPPFVAITPTHWAIEPQQLLKVGFTAAFSSLQQRDRLFSLLIKKFNSMPMREPGIEQAVTNSLPWRA